MNPPRPVTASYRNYVLAMLTIVYVFNFVDRQLLVILQESIKAELGLSDTQLGLLTGFTFAIFYATLGIPIARIADKWNRRNVVVLSLTVWSGMTALSGAVQNFFQLLLARIGVGVGEAGGSPPAHAMLSDYFPPEKRAKALAIYSTGIYIGILVGFLVGGYLNGVVGWRKAFLLVGVPGVIFAALLYATVREPVKGQSEGAAPAETTTLGQVVRTLMTRKAFIWIALGTGFQAFAMYGTINWMPSMLFRIHEMSSAQVGISLGLIVGLGGATGTLASGYLADRWGSRNPQWYLRIPALGAVIGLPFALVAILSNNPVLVLTCLSVVNVFYSAFLAPCIAITHNLVPPNLRAFSSAVLFFVLNLIGLGFGPLGVGFLSDLLEPTYGIYALRWAMLITIVVVIIAIAMYLKGARYVQNDLEKM